MKLKTIRLAARLVAQDIRKEKRFNDYSWLEATKRVAKRYQLKGKYLRDKS